MPGFVKICDAGTPREWAVSALDGGNTNELALLEIRGANLYLSESSALQLLLALISIMTVRASGAT